ncbi:hypothetical protein WDU94_007483 [Cyamophila willieti]
MNHLSQYRNSAIAAPHSHQSSSSSSHFSSANCLQSFPSSSRFSPHNFMERVMQIPNDLSRYQVSNFEQTRLETLSELDKIQTMNSGNCYGKSSSSSVATSAAGSSCSNGVLSSESRNYLSASNLVNTPMVDTKIQIREDSNLLPASNNTTTTSSSKNCNDCFKIPTQASASTSTSPLVIAKCMIDVSTMTDPLTMEEQERLGQWEGFAAVQSGNKVAEYLTSLRQFLKLTPPGESKKRGGLGDVRIVTSPDGSRLYCCSECQMAYPDKTLLEQHLAQHKVERRFICNICGAGLKRKEHLDRHQLSHSTDRPFTCGACPKTFKRNEHLARHYVTHSGEKHQVCTECGKAFYRRDHLQKHFQGHLTKRLRMAAMQTT